jgi:hypothetical protein
MPVDDDDNRMENAKQLPPPTLRYEPRFRDIYFTMQHMPAWFLNITAGALSLSLSVPLQLDGILTQRYMHLDYIWGI